MSGPLVVTQPMWWQYYDVCRRQQSKGNERQTENLYFNRRYTAHTDRCCTMKWRHTCVSLVTAHAGAEMAHDRYTIKQQTSYLASHTPLSSSYVLVLRWGKQILKLKSRNRPVNIPFFFAWQQADHWVWLNNQLLLTRCLLCVMLTTNTTNMIIIHISEAV